LNEEEAITAQGEPTGGVPEGSGAAVGSNGIGRLASSLEDRNF
jgi:hypothetical protein